MERKDKQKKYLYDWNSQDYGTYVTQGRKIEKKQLYKITEQI